MSSKHFLTATNCWKKIYVTESQIESKIKAMVKEKSFLEYLLARMFYLT